MQKIDVAFKRTLIDLFVMKEETIYLKVCTGMQMSHKE